MSATKRWGHTADRCRDCGTAERPEHDHERGLCASCAETRRWAVRPRDPWVSLDDVALPGDPARDGGVRGPRLPVSAPRVGKKPQAGWKNAGRNG